MDGHPQAARASTSSSPCSSSARYTCASDARAAARHPSDPNASGNRGDRLI